MKKSTIDINTQEFTEWLAASICDSEDALTAIYELMQFKNETELDPMQVTTLIANHHTLCTKLLVSRVRTETQKAELLSWMRENDYGDTNLYASIQDSRDVKVH